MSRHTSLKVGGPADLYAEPEDADDLLALVRALKERRAPWLAIGRGYNLLVRDGGIRGAVISLARFNRISEAGERLVRAEAGAENLALVRFAQERGLGGIGYISGIPGTVGGAVKMNAGAYGSGVLERLESLTLLEGDAVAEYRREELDYGYRRLTLPAGAIVLAAQFRLVACNPQQTEEEIRKDTELRRTKHNVGFPSAGSFFKNPAGQAAWRLIDGAGLRGLAVGGAQVSEVHSNFLINRGGATAADFLALAEKVKEAVLAASGVQLEEEVRIVGEEP
ncbi:UDP-N-acetylmuramate dehydrogenase [Geobacter sp. FeAm09]|uniref:UDP-N-acetylmuramate dehydrogenase n=1 Tax=Geobacter sp. FeAm09 TaxID=2597769 RepID=UPI001F0E270B